MVIRFLTTYTLALLLLLSTGCGYRVAGKGDMLPPNIRTIAIPAFGNATVRYKLSDRLPQALGREFILRTKYRIVADPADADAILTGSINNIFVGNPIYDPVTNRAANSQLFVQMRISLIDAHTKKVIYENQTFDYRTRYEISTVDEGSGRRSDLNVYFDESDSALDRLSHEVARSVVSAVLEKF